MDFGFARRGSRIRTGTGCKNAACGDSVKRAKAGRLFFLEAACLGLGEMAELETVEIRVLRQRVLALGF